MSINERRTLERIRAEYSEREVTKMDELRALDKKVARPAEIFAYTFGIIGALVLGLGMCLAMKVIFASLSYMMFVGIAVGLVGILMVSVNYFWYKNILASRKKKYAPRILALADELLGNQA